MGLLGRALRRSVAAVLLLLVWSLLLAGAVAALRLPGPLDGIVAAVLMLLAALYLVVAVSLFATGASLAADDPARWLGTPAFMVAMAAAYCGIAVPLGFESWYLSRHGVQTHARVTAAHCVEGSGPDCEQALRVASGEIGPDLGWVRCNGTGHWEVGEMVQVRTDPHGWARPEIANCPRHGFLTMLVPLTPLGAATAFALAAAAPFARWRPRSR